jgi:predicted ATP-grasp superfamily ATP-dependent carboligase
MGRVLVTDAGARNVVAAIRSLGRKNLDVIAGEESRIAMGFFSKYCRERLVYPSPKTSPKKWLEWLLDELSKRRYDMLMPMDDETVSITSENRSLIEKYTKVPVPDFATLMKAKDKAQTVQIAMQEGVPCPRTFFPQDISQIKQALAELEIPIVIKPRESSGSRGIVYVRHKEDVVESYLGIHSKYPFPMIQEYIPPGGQSCGVFLLFNKDSEPRAVFAHKRLREFPLRGGPSTLRESIYKPELAEMAIKMLRAMKWYGVAMVEFKEDPRDGQFKIMEVNPRFWGSLQLPILSGVDFPYLLYKMEMNGDIEPVTKYQIGVRCRWLLPGDILHFIYNPKRFHLEPGFFDFSKNNRQDDFISWRDPGPTLGFFFVVFRNLFNLDKWRHVLRR